MMTLAERNYLNDAKTDLSDVKTEADLVKWHDIWMSGEDYLHLPEHAIRDLEEAYQAKVAWFYGVGGG